MAENLSNYEENHLLDHSLGTAEYAFVSTVYVALYLSDPTDADVGEEVSGGGYGRQVAAFDPASGGASSNTEDIQFGPATEDWGTVTHVGIRDASTEGNLKWYGPLDESNTVEEHDYLKIEAGELNAALK